MPRFFFHFHDGTSQTLDDTGVEFGSAEEAYLGAFGAARDMWPELIDARQDPMGCAFEIADAQGAALFQLPFAETLESCQISPKKPASSAEIQRGIDEVTAGCWPLAPSCGSVSIARAPRSSRRKDCWLVWMSSLRQEAGE